MHRFLLVAKQLETKWLPEKVDSSECPEAPLFSLPISPFRGRFRDQAVDRSDDFATEELQPCQRLRHLHRQVSLSSVSYGQPCREPGHVYDSHPRSPYAPPMSPLLGISTCSCFQLPGLLWHLAWITAKLRAHRNELRTDSWNQSVSTSGQHKSDSATQQRMTVRKRLRNVPLLEEIPLVLPNFRIHFFQ